MIWVGQAGTGPKLNFTVVARMRRLELLAERGEGPLSEAAAKTVIVPVEAADGELLALGDELPDPLLLEQPATATAASPAAITAKRRIVIP